MDNELRKLFFETLDQEINSIINPKTGKVFKKYVKNINCPICKNDGKEDYLFSKNGFDFVRCINCELIYTNPQPKVNLLEKIYKNSESANIWIKLQGSKKEISWKKEYYLDNIRFIKNYLKNDSLKLLDLGCNNGLFLEYVNENTEWDSLGIDLNKKAIQIARNKGLNVRNGNFSEINENFDLITMFGVLEHIPNPLDLLNEIIKKQIEKKSWYISIIVPNIFSLFHFLLKEKSPSIDGREHIIYFSMNSLIFFLRKLGFINIKCDTVLSGLEPIKEQLQWHNYNSFKNKDLKFIPDKLKKEIMNGNMEKFINDYDLGLRLRVIAEYKNTF